MADPGLPIFNTKAAEKLRSPDDLDKYVRVTNPSVWVVIAACIALLAGLLSWGVFGTVATTVSAKAVSDGAVVAAFLPIDKTQSVSVGDFAYVEGKRLQVESISSVPISREEAKDVVHSDYLATSLIEDDWAYLVKLNGDGIGDLAKDVPLYTTITTELVPPISLIFGGKS